MGRSIVYAQAETSSSSRSVPGGGVAPAPEPDKYADILLKLIPAEVLTLYMAMDGVITSNSDHSPTLTWIVFGIGIVATWFYLHVFQKVNDRQQIIISVLAFGIWAINIGQGFREPSPLIDPSYAALALLAFTFFAPKIPQRKKAAPLPPL